MKATKYSKER